MPNQIKEKFQLKRQQALSIVFQPLQPIIIISILKPV